jgi:hypothetical protein
MARLEHALPGRLRHAGTSQSWDLPLTANPGGLNRSMQRDWWKLSQLAK